MIDTVSSERKAVSRSVAAAISIMPTVVVSVSAKNSAALSWVASRARSEIRMTSALVARKNSLKKSASGSRAMSPKKSP